MVTLVCMCETEGDSGVGLLVVAVGSNDVGDADGSNDVREVDVEDVSVIVSTCGVPSMFGVRTTVSISYGTATLIVVVMLAIVKSTPSE